MAEIKQFEASTKVNPKPEKPAEIIDFPQNKKESAPVVDDQETKQLLETLSHLINKLFEESQNKEGVVKSLRNLAD